MHVEVDWTKCEGNAVCMSLTADVFKVEADEKSHVLQHDPPEELRSKVVEAVKTCPTQAISLSD